MPSPGSPNGRQPTSDVVRRSIEVIQEMQGIGHPIRYVHAATLELYQGMKPGITPHLNPIALTPYWIIQTGGKKIRSGKTSSKGRCGLKVAPGRYLLDVAHQDYQPMTVGIVVPEYDAPAYQEIQIEMKKWDKAEVSALYEA